MTEWKSREKAGVFRTKIIVSTEAEGSATNITTEVLDAVKQAKIKNGMVNVFSVGATGAVISTENEAGLFEDLREAMKRMFPKEGFYKHEMAWQDGNAHSHLKASILGPELTIPIIEGELGTGVWQQIVLLNNDTRDRKRKIIVTVIGV